MTLPFSKDKSRKWQCFVCGREYKEYDEFVDHILDEHDEGREFIICPRCEAPVRDLKMHFAAKHRGMKMPKGVQHKVMVWKDHKKTGGKTKTPHFRKGELISRKNGGKPMLYRSSYEEKVYSLLEQWDEVAGYDVEPCKIPYSYRGRARHYKPDLIIQFFDRVEMWEIKPANQTSQKLNQAKWSSAKTYCLARGWSFQVITEVGIGKLQALLNG